MHSIPAVRTPKVLRQHVQNSPLTGFHSGFQGGYKLSRSGQCPIADDCSAGALLLIMALARCLADLRGSLLSRLQLPASVSLESLGQPVSLSLFRGFAESTYIDKNQVTERILNVIKKHEKVDQAKVSYSLDHACTKAETQEGGLKPV